MEKKVLIRIKKDGSVIAEASGFKGTECLKATEFITRTLGIPTKTIKKSSFDEVEEKTKISDGLPSGWCG